MTSNFSFFSFGKNAVVQVPAHSNMSGTEKTFRCVMPVEWRFALRCHLSVRVKKGFKRSIASARINTAQNEVVG